MDLQGMQYKHDNFQMFDCEVQKCANKADVLTDKRRRLCNSHFETTDDKELIVSSLRHKPWQECTCSFAGTIRAMSQIEASQSISQGILNSQSELTKAPIKAVEQLNLSGGSQVLADSFLQIQSAVMPRICDLSNDELLDQIHGLDRLIDQAKASKIIVNNYLSGRLQRATDSEREIIRDKDKQYRALPREKEGAKDIKALLLKRLERLNKELAE